MRSNGADLGVLGLERGNFVGLTLESAILFAELHCQCVDLPMMSSMMGQVDLINGMQMMKVCRAKRNMIMDKRGHCTGLDHKSDHCELCDTCCFRLDVSESVEFSRSSSCVAQSSSSVTRFRSRTCHHHNHQNHHPRRHPHHRPTESIIMTQRK